MTSAVTKPAIIVIFGVTGDLAKRKLLPALYHLMRDNLLHPDTQVIGVTRQKLTKNEVLKPLDKYISSHARPSPTALRHFKQSFHLLPIDISTANGYKELKKHLDEKDKSSPNAFQRLYYLSIPPAVFDEVVTFMGEAGLQKSYKNGPQPALLVEKPFGYDLSSAKLLIKSVQKYFLESQVYRIDHYLAKEMAQNILDFRFNNSMFESIWNRQYIDNIVITAHEKIDIEGRGNFYEQTGALRDLLQSHMLQLMGLVAMERPKLTNGASIHREQLRLLNAIDILEPYNIENMAIRAQYKGYKKEVKSRRSNTETYAAVKLTVNNERWRGVPFILRTGKAVHEKRTAIDISFGDNVLTLRLQPDEAIYLGVHTKKPGYEKARADAVMELNYKRSFPTATSQEAYERVIYDAIRQDSTLFASSKEVIASWKVLNPVLQEWSKNISSIQIYEKGSHGPLSVKKLQKLIRFQQR